MQLRWATPRSPRPSLVWGGDDRTTGTQVTRALGPLQLKQMVSVDVPVGEKASSRRRRYRIADPYLRFWFRFCAAEIANIERGRADLARDRYRRDYASWRGRAVEAVVHGAVNRLATESKDLFAGTEVVGSWWDRSNDHEYDVVTADRRDRVGWVGTVKWRTNRPVTRSEISDLEGARSVVPNADTAQLLAVCPAGVAPGVHVDRVLTVHEILDAYR